MKKLLASVLCAVMAIGLVPMSLHAAARQTGQVSGRALADGKPLQNVTVQLRNVDTGQLVGSTKVGPDGSFSFTGLQAGNFVVETLGANGTIIGTSATIALTAGAMVAAGITVSSSAAAVAGAGAAAGAIGGAAAGGGAFGLSTTALIVTGSVIAAGTTLGIVAATNNASASQ